MTTEESVTGHLALLTAARRTRPGAASFQAPVCRLQCRTRSLDPSIPRSLDPSLGRLQYVSGGRWSDRAAAVRYNPGRADASAEHQRLKRPK